MRIITWNVNSLRLRIELVRRLVAEAAPDVLCLQEIKAEAHQVPTEALATLGFTHQRVSGFKGYNGVAILSRLPLEDLPGHPFCGREDGRHVAAVLPGGIELHNLYVPAGGDVPDPDANPKFAHKLQFLGELAGWAKGLTPGRSRILVGDLNVAPLPTDVWSHTALLDVVCHTPVEVDLFGRAQAAQGWVDAVRTRIPPEEKLYSWWSYRARDWSASDRGRRIDHVWVSPDLASRVTDARILRAARDWPGPSDHVPVIVDFDAEPTQRR